MTMPLWTWEEMETLREQFYQDTVDLKRARENFDLWYGGVPRLVLERPSTLKDERRDSSLVLKALNTTSVEQVSGSCFTLCSGYCDLCTSHFTLTYIDILRCLGLNSH